MATNAFDGVEVSKEPLKNGNHEDGARSGCDPTFGIKGFIEELEKHFGYKLLWLLFAVQFLLKGLALDLRSRAEPWVYKLYHVPAPKMQVYNGVTQLPWAVKPIIGLVSDLCPIRGINKAPYMLATSLLGVAAFLTVG